MPVHLESHSPELEIDPSTTKGRILAFLYQNPEYGFRPAEIQEELDIPHGTATTTLSRLLNEGYVGKTSDSYYHALEGRTDLEHYAAAYSQLTRLTERYSERPPLEATQTMTREDQLEEAHEARTTEESVNAELDALEDGSDSDNE